jgi:hypothetical protein
VNNAPSLTHELQLLLQTLPLYVMNSFPMHKTPPKTTDRPVNDLSWSKTCHSLKTENVIVCRCRSQVSGREGGVGGRRLETYKLWREGEVQRR